MKIIVFDSDQLNDYVFNKTYNQAYNYLMSKTGMVISTDVKDNVNNLRILHPEKGVASIPHDIITQTFLRSSNIPKVGANFTNPISLHLAFKNKAALSNILYNKYEIQSIDNKFIEVHINKLKHEFLLTMDSMGVSVNDTLVMKPKTGNKGKGIYFYSPSQIHAFFHSYDHKPKDYIFQKEVSFEKIPELGISGRHDIRLIMVNGNICEVVVRQPGPGQKIANYATGGSITSFKLNHLPPHIRVEYENMASYVHSRIYHFMKVQDGLQYIVGIDTAWTNEGIKIFELNSYPGLRLEYDSYMAELINMFK